MHFNVDSCSLLMCSHEHKTILTAGLFGKLINKPQQMEFMGSSKRWKQRSKQFGTQRWKR